MGQKANIKISIVFNNYSTLLKLIYEYFILVNSDYFIIKSVFGTLSMKSNLPVISLNILQLQNTNYFVFFIQQYYPYEHVKTPQIIYRFSRIPRIPEAFW